MYTPLELEPERRINIHFRVGFATKWGQNLYLVGSGALLGNWKWQRGHRMRCHHEKDQLVWEVLVALPWQEEYCYKYCLMTDDAGSGGEGGRLLKMDPEERCVRLHPGLQNGDIVEVLDVWPDKSYPTSIMATAAFTKVLRPRVWSTVRGLVEHKAPAIAEAVVHFEVADWMAQEGEVLCVTGSIPQLGNWQPDQMLVLQETTPPHWEGEVRVPYSGFQFTYKYAVLSKRQGVVLETGEARVAALPLAGSPHMGAPAVVVRHDAHFRRDRMWRGCGVAVPVFSLVTHDSVGAGEFLDLLQLIDLAADTGMRLIQILPVNDTSVYNMWWDSYPYSTLSVFALHPLYLSLRQLRHHLPDDITADIDSARMHLAGKQVDYEATMAAKLRIARVVFNRYGAETLSLPAFKHWFSANAEWLVPYAVFVHLRQLTGSAEHWRWGVLAHPTPELLARVSAPNADWASAIRFTYYLQYQLHCQLSRVSAYAHTRRVVLKGDLPIGVDKRSVDTWLSPELFRMDKSTGAPPDYFDPNGQNWGFPTYNWEAMSRDDYAWWRRRLHHMAQYFTAYRIDHILGFFRIWEIPGDCVTGLLGHFRPSIPIRRSDLEQRGIWDLDRLCEPYVRWPLLEQMFGNTLALEVSAKYFVEVGNGQYCFRPQYSSEKLINDIPVRPDSPDWLRKELSAVKTGLMRLRQNVCLLRDDEDPHAFYPRFALRDTSSWRDLDAHVRNALLTLHDNYFFRQQEDTWRANALRTLPVLMGATDMLVCGEDLGFVPQCVPPVMQELGLIGLRIQRMSTEEGKDFNNPALYPYLVVASPSCHDVAPTRAWYEEDPDRRDRFYYTVLRGCGQPPKTCTASVMRSIAVQHLDSPAVWTIFPIQDIMALSQAYTDRPAAEEIINDPTNPKHYWRFRLHVPLERLRSDTLLINTLRQLLLSSGRACPEDFEDYDHRQPDSDAANAINVSAAAAPAANGRGSAAFHIAEEDGVLLQAGAV